MSTAGHQWAVEHIRGTAAEVHGLDVAPHTNPCVWVVDVVDRALVLGSAQPESSVDADAVAAAGISLVRRRSGGGAVLVDASSLLWVDVIVPSSAPQWDDDVGRSAMWLGQVWAGVVQRLGFEPTLHEPPMARDDLARLVCFVGRGPGEVSVGGQKVVGVSQRRTRQGARFQCAVVLEWDADTLLSLMTPLSEVDKRRVRGAALGLGVSSEAVVDLFVDELAGR